MFEIHTALDFKYPSYRGGKWGYQSLIICMCRQLVFVKDATVASLIVWRFGPKFRVLHRCDSETTHAATTAHLKPIPLQIEPICSGTWLYRATPGSLSQTLLAMSLTGQEQAVALRFLLRNVISSNQWGINQRHSILLEWLWHYLENSLSAAWGEARSCCNHWSQNCSKTFTESSPEGYVWVVRPPVLSPVIKKWPLAFPLDPLWDTE